MRVFKHSHRYSNNTRVNFTNFAAFNLLNAYYANNLHKANKYNKLSLTRSKLEENFTQNHVNRCMINKWFQTKPTNIIDSH